MSSQTQSFNNKNYSTVISLNERTIYIKVTDNINYLMYESNVDSKELRLSIDLEDVYKIMVNCFNEVKDKVKDNDNYMLKFTINSGTMKLSFSARVGGYLKVSFEILLREKLMSNDGQLTVNFNRLEQQQQQAITSLTDKCANLEASINKMQQIIDCCQIFVTNIYTPQGHWCDIQGIGQTQLLNINVKELSLVHGNQIAWRNIEAFYQLEKLTIHTITTLSNLDCFKSNTLKELTLNNCNSTFTSITGIQNFPNLEILTIISAGSLTNVTKVLTDTKHKIKTLKFQSCAGINVVELQTYCQVNNVFLALS